MNKSLTEKEKELREKLADIEHRRWSDWQSYVFSKCGAIKDGMVIPQWAVEQWKRQIDTPYEKLSEKEKDSDRREVDRYFPHLSESIEQAREEGVQSQIVERYIAGFEDGIEGERERIKKWLVASEKQEYQWGKKNEGAVKDIEENAIYNSALADVIDFLDNQDK